jgi:hypothetical protein
MYIFSPLCPEPGIEARMPIVSGCLAVSQMLTVAHSSGDLSTAGGLAGVVVVGVAAAPAPEAPTARTAAPAATAEARAAAARRGADTPQM